jgi:hypothetical protein
MRANSSPPPNSLVTRLDETTSLYPDALPSKRLRPTGTTPPRLAHVGNAHASAVQPSHKRKNFDQVSGAVQTSAKQRTHAKTLQSRSPPRQAPEPEPVIRAPPDTKADDPLVSPYGYMINTTHQVLICPPCGIIVKPSAAREHIVREHKTYTKPPPEFDARLKSTHPGLTFAPRHPAPSVPIVFGLKPPLDKLSLVCPDCNHGYAETTYYKSATHQCIAKGSQRARTGASKTRVQRFSRANDHGWFAVHAPAPYPFPRLAPDALQLYRQQNPITIAQGEGPIVPENYRNLQQFVSKENWPALLSRDPLEILLKLTEPPTAQEGFKHLTRQVHVYLDQYQAIIKAGVPFSVRRDLGTRPSPERHSSYIVHHKDVQQDTLLNYARIISRLLAFIMRIQERMDSHREYPSAVHLTTMQVEAARRLQNLLTSDPDLQHAEAEEEEQEQDQLAEAEDDEEDDRECEDDGLVADVPRTTTHVPRTTPRTGAIPIIPPESTVPSPMSVHRCARVQQGIFALLYAVFTQLPQGHESRWHNPLSLFVPYISRYKDGTYIAPGCITHFIAAITFTARICMFTVMHIEVSHDPSMRLSE